MKFKMYSSLVMGFLCTMTGALLILISNDRGVTDFFFLAGLISEAYFVILFALSKGIKIK